MASQNPTTATPTPLPSSSSLLSTTNSTLTEKNKNARPGLSKMHEFVTILVDKDPNTKKLIVHKEFACHYSPIFKSAFNSEFEEGRTQTYHLQDAYESTVQLLVQWLYTQTLDSDEMSKKTKDQRIRQLARLWVLADKLLIPRLQNNIVHEILAEQIRSQSVPTACLYYVYNNTKQGSQLRLLFLHICANVGTSVRECLKSHPKHFPKDLLLELAAYQNEALEAGMNRVKWMKRIEKLKISDYEVPEF